MTLAPAYPSSEPDDTAPAPSGVVAAQRTRRPKDRLLDAIVQSPLLPAFTPLSRGAATVFMLHRFADPELGVPGHSVERLRENLALLRRHRFRPTSLVSLVERLRNGEPLQARTVVFTVDDGYADFGRVAAPVFAEFDCPVTVFVTTGFVDERRWGWWDRVFHGLEETRRTTLDMIIGTTPVRLAWSDWRSRRAAADVLIEGIKHLPGDQRPLAIARLLDLLDVETPARPPARYQAMTWQDIRRCAGMGVQFGPHTITHPALAETSDAQARREIEGSWTRLRAMTDAAVPLFCYPYGEPFAYGERECALVREAGLLAGLSACHGYATPAQFRTDAPLARFALPRFPYREESGPFLKVASGIERAHAGLRGLLRRAR